LNSLKLFQPSHCPLKLPKFLLRNYEILQQFKTFMRNFSGVIDLAETILAGSLATLKRFQRGIDPAEISNRHYGAATFFKKRISSKTMS
jgi:hypothetical protein